MKNFRNKAGVVLAAVYDGGESIKLLERDVPRIAADEALLKVKACAICSTDRRILRFGHRRILPGTQRILGHELAGEIVELGSRVTRLKIGMRVGLSPNIGCGICDQCIRGYTNLCPDYIGLGVGVDGGFAEYMRIPAPYILQGNVMEIPNSVSYEEAALNEPLSCVYHGLRACQIQLNEAVLIVGAGPIGLMMLQLAKLMGAGLVIMSQRSPARRLLAEKFGADVVINPQEQTLTEVVKELTGGRGVDVALVAAPSPEAQASVIEVMAPRGRVNFFGGLPTGKDRTSLDANLIHYRELCVTGTTGQTVADYRTTMSFLVQKRIDVANIITGRFALKDIVVAFEHADSKEGLKTVIYPGTS